MSACEFSLGRIFLDSSTLQTLLTFGEHVYDGAKPLPSTVGRLSPSGSDDLSAFRDLMQVAQQGSILLLLSDTSVEEVLASRRASYISWLGEWLDKLSYDGRIPGAYRPSGRGYAIALRLKSSAFNFLSRKDLSLLYDALALECGVFLTMDGRLAKNGDTLRRQLGIHVLRPHQFLRLCFTRKLLPA